MPPHWPVGCASIHLEGSYSLPAQVVCEPRRSHNLVTIWYASERLALRYRRAERTVSVSDLIEAVATHMPPPGQHAAFSEGMIPKVGFKLHIDHGHSFLSVVLNSAM